MWGCLRSQHHNPKSNVYRAFGFTETIRKGAKKLASIAGPFHSGNGIANLEGHPELEYRDSSAHRRSFADGKARTFFTIRSLPVRTISVVQVGRLRAITHFASMSSPTTQNRRNRDARSGFFSVICASTKQKLEKYLDSDPPMKIPMLKSLPADCRFEGDRGTGRSPTGRNFRPRCDARDGGPFWF